MTSKYFNEEIIDNLNLSNYLEWAETYAANLGLHGNGKEGLAISNALFRNLNFRIMNEFKSKFLSYENKIIERDLNDLKCDIENAIKYANSEKSKMSRLQNIREDFISIITKTRNELCKL